MEVFTNNYGSQPIQSSKMPLERFLGRVAILTGSTQGIGLATARRLGQEGCKVIISSRRQENVDKAVKHLTKEGIEACGITANQRIKEDRQKFLKLASEKYGGFDHVFISAGVSPHRGSLLTVTEEQFDRIFDTNLKSNFQFIQECVPYMEKRGGGSIVTNSTAGVYGVTAAVIGKVCKYCIVKLQQMCISKRYR
ncbi:Dehydrogenase/reductase SDR family member 4 [Holothuria leucospilota]|uniref:Dehydrogenase/reductase SDR family member 4 n=1 Tax=Holothuria leucospilota TaxID=206669 RepID=A0A9Q1CQ53_HOLLE|nr:Dehydrogenase/reductase SDR family member 4 [Holothuria leucospilota]